MQLQLATPKQLKRLLGLAVFAQDMQGGSVVQKATLASRLNQDGGEESRTDFSTSTIQSCIIDMISSELAQFSEEALKNTKAAFHALEVDSMLEEFVREDTTGTGALTTTQMKACLKNCGLRWTCGCTAINAPAYLYCSRCQQNRPGVFRDVKRGKDSDWDMEAVRGFISANLASLSDPKPRISVQNCVINELVHLESLRRAEEVQLSPEQLRGLTSKEVLALLKQQRHGYSNLQLARVSFLLHALQQLAQGLSTRGRLELERDATFRELLARVGKAGEAGQIVATQEALCVSALNALRVSSTQRWVRDMRERCANSASPSLFALNEFSFEERLLFIELPSFLSSGPYLSIKRVL
eukprot:g18646.t1